MKIKIRDSIHLKKTQKDWLEFFQYNFVLEPNFSMDRPLTQEEQTRLTKSIQAFAMGESSEGKHLKRVVRQYVQDSGNETYAQIMDLFIQEENQHSTYLNIFMEAHFLESKKEIWIDKVFRKLRAFNGLKGEILTLMTAEIIALSFYQALSKSVSTPSLKEICGKMLYDESAHIVFQSRQLSTLSCSKGIDIYRRFLLTLSGVAAWLYCKPVFKAGGYGFTDYFREIHSHLKESIEIVHRGDYQIG